MYHERVARPTEADNIVFKLFKFMFLRNDFIPVRIIHLLHSLSMFLKIPHFRIDELREGTLRTVPNRGGDEGECCNVS